MQLQTSIKMQLDIPHQLIYQAPLKHCKQTKKCKNSSQACYNFVYVCLVSDKGTQREIGAVSLLCKEAASNVILALLFFVIFM